MPGLAICFISIWAVAVPPKLPRDVHEYPSRNFHVPLTLDEGTRAKVERMRLFISEDQGKSWKHYQDCKPTAVKAAYNLPDDGLYWLSTQLVFKDGKCEPSDLADLIPDQKLFINTTGRPVGVPKSYADLRRENQELRKRVEELQKKLEDNEPRRKPE